MPDHYTLIALCGPGYDYRNDEDDPTVFDVDAFNEAKPDLCREVMPMPDELSNIVASSEPCRHRNKETGEFHNSVNGPVQDREQWEQVTLTGEERKDLRDRFGADNWLDWCVNNWGTKWGTYDISATELGGDSLPILLSMQTAWGPPKILPQITEWLKEKYGFTSVVWSGFNPGSDTAETISLTEAGGK